MSRTPRPANGPVWCLASVLAFSILVFGRAAVHLPFWYDESLTVRLSRLHGLRELWQALRAGFEFNPPLIYLATKAARMLPGPETLTARLPGLTGFVLLSLGLFVLLQRRLGAWFALAAVALLPLADYSVRYTIEARAYMLLLGVSAWALVFWQSSANSRSRMAPIGLALTTAAALMLHVWAIILPIALLAGELIWWVQTRSLRRSILWALAAASPILALYPILLRASRTVVFGGAAYQPTPDKLYAAFRSDLPRPRVIAAAVVVALAAAWWERRHGSSPSSPRSVSAPEMAVVLVLLASPALPYLYASSAEGAFMTRYGLFALPAVICLAGICLYVVGQGFELAGQAAAAAAMLGVVVYFPPKVPTSGSQSAVVETLATGPSLDPNVPLVLVNPVDVTAFDEQASDSMIGRAMFVADPDLALEYTRTNGIDLGYVRGAPYLRLRIRQRSYDDLTAGANRLYLVGKWQSLSWLPQKLTDDGWTMTAVGGLPQAPIFDARR